MIKKKEVFYLFIVFVAFMSMSLFSCSGSNKNYDYQLAWSNFKIVNINVKDDYKVQKLLSELGVSPIPEYIDIEVISGYENDNYIRLDGTLKRYNWSELSPGSQSYLRNYRGINKIKIN